MPEMHFLIRWPDGRAERCYSPSLVVRDYLAAGQSYPLAEFLARGRTALAVASRRVEEKYGAPCSRALAQLARLQDQAGRYADDPAARVVVEAFEAPAEEAR